MLSIYSIYYSTSFTPLIIDSIIYSIIFVLLASILPVHASSGTSDDKFKRNRNLLAAALGPLFAIVLLTYDINLYILMAGGLLWVLIFLILLLIFVSAIKFLPKKFKISFGIFARNPWLLPLIILGLTILLRFFLLEPLSLGLKRILDFIIYIAMFAVLMTIAFQSRKKEINPEKDTDRDIKKLSKRLKDTDNDDPEKAEIEQKLNDLNIKKTEIQNKKDFYYSLFNPLIRDISAINLLLKKAVLVANSKNEIKDIKDLIDSILGFKNNLNKYFGDSNFSQSINNKLNKLNTKYDVGLTTFSRFNERLEKRFDEDSTKNSLMVYEKTSLIKGFKSLEKRFKILKREYEQFLLKSL